MATLLEKIAANKALAAATSTPAPIAAPVAVEETVQAVVVPEGKTLSFAEKMALKKLHTEDPKATTPIATVPPVKEPLISSLDNTEPSQSDLESQSPEVQQAYIDIKAKIDKLADMSEINLKDAMTDLKKSLLQNPQACYLIMPYDIGQMVVALRAIREEAVVEAEAEKTKGPKKARISKQLTAEEIAQAFDEL